MKSTLLKNCSLLLVLILITLNSLKAQDNLQKARQVLLSDASVKDFTLDNELKTASSISFKQGSNYSTTEAQSLIKKYFALDLPGEELRLQSTTPTKSGIQVQRYKLFYNNIPLVHSSYVVMSQNGKISAIQAESYILNTGFSIVPALSANTARTKALDFVKATRYAWQDLEEEKLKAAGNPAAIAQYEKLIEEYYPKGELVIAKNKYGDGQAVLAWKFDIYATAPVGRWYIYIDAVTGKVILRDAIIKHSSGEKQKPSDPLPIDNTLKKEDQPFKPQNKLTQSMLFAPLASELGSGTTRYAGTRNFYTTRLSVPLLGTTDPNNTLAPLQYSGTDPRLPVFGPIDVFILQDDTRGVGRGITTYDMNGVGGLPVSVPALATQALAFVDKDNNWKNEAAPGTNEDIIRGTSANGTNGVDEALNDDYALDAHWGAEMVYDYWKTVHNRLSYDNLNTGITSYVHYGPAYDNAFWNGTAMTYGDGSGTIASGFRPLTSLDVCGHEIGHGVCSFTSDLVYESESGAMNEGLSDIWAACVERFVKTTVDNTLPFQYFQVGEQIAADNIGLRRMDNPKANSNPDTYGGQHWVNPVCTPTLANDECGVHTNSGVLNKWFYLLVQGPATTTGAPGYLDDGLADNGAVVNGGNNYGALGPAGTGEFIGLGFDKAEAITYLMELLLTPNATYASARTASINAVRSLYGECSQEEKTVTDAWFAVNVGPAYAPCGLPLISASTLTTDVNEFAAGQCDRYNEYSINTNLTAVQGSTVTINFSVGSTTMSPDEYALSSSAVTYTPGQSGLRTVKLRIYDDAMVEADETITINVTSSSPALSSSFTFTVRNDDTNPVFANNQVLLNENFESTAVGSLPASWAVINRTPAATVQWNVRSNGILPLNWSGKRAIIEQTLLTGQATYDQLTEAQLILKTPVINAQGLNSVKVQFVYQAGGEPACTPACDYAQLVYSMDGTNFNQMPAGGSAPLYLQLTDSTFSYTLPSMFNGKQFYLGVLWTNDANGGTSTSVTIDNFLVTANGRRIESTLASAVSEKVNAETGKPSYFYSTEDGEIITKLSNTTAHNYGCVATSIEKAGTSGFELYVAGTDHHRVADKVVRVTPTTNNAGGAYDISLYFTEAEIVALEGYTGFNRNLFYIYKTSAAVYTGANAGNTVRTPATYTALPGSGGFFTASFSTGFSAFALGALVSIPLPVNCLQFAARKKDNNVELVWKVDREVNNSHFEIESSSDGVQYNVIATITANAASNGNYSYTDVLPSGKRIFYRLKQVDRNGQSRYICNIISIPLNDIEGFTISNVYPNPSAGESFVTIYTSRARKINMEYVNTMGQVLGTQSLELQAGSTRVNLKLKERGGSFIVKFRDEQGSLLGYQKFNKL